jgi:hypothetical protein
MTDKIKRMKPSIKIYLSLVILLFSNFANGQINFEKGYIVNLNNDTVHGLISDRGEIRNATKCIFKEHKKGEVVKYNPTEIKSYGFINGKRYHSIKESQKEESKNVFAEVLINGELNLYHIGMNNNSAYCIESEDGVITRLTTEHLSLKDNSTSFYKPPKYYMFEIESYKNSLDSIFKNCKDMKSKIDGLEYDTKQLVNITKEYLNCNCKKKKCIDYEKDFNISKPTFGVFSGVQLSEIYFLQSKINSNISISFPFGLFYNVPLKLINERISFQAELIYNNLKYNQGFNNLPNIYSDIFLSSELVSIPLSLRYTLPMNKVSASIGIGKAPAYIFNSKANTIPCSSGSNGIISIVEFEYREKGFFIHHSQKEGWFFELGVDYKASPKFSIFSNFRVQSNLNLIIEEENYTNYRFYIAEKMNNLVNPHRNIYRTNSATLFLGVKF